METTALKASLFGLNDKPITEKRKANYGILGSLVNYIAKCFEIPSTTNKISPNVKVLEVSQNLYDCLIYVDGIDIEINENDTLTIFSKMLDTETTYQKIDAMIKFQGFKNVSNKDVEKLIQDSIKENKFFFMANLGELDDEADRSLIYKYMKQVGEQFLMELDKKDSLLLLDECNKNKVELNIKIKKTTYYCDELDIKIEKITHYCWIKN